MSETSPIDESAAPANAGRFVEVAVTVPVDGTFTYRVPDDLILAQVELQKGQRVLVPFGGRRLTGIVIDTEPPAPEGYVAKDLLEVLDLSPLLSEDLISLCVFAADYYLHPLGDVLRTALPPGMALRGSRFLVLPPEAGAERGEEPTGAAAEVLARLREAPAGRLRVGGRGGVPTTVASRLLRAGWVEVRESWEGVRGKRQVPKVVRQQVSVADARLELQRAPAQRAVMEWLEARGEVASRQELLAAVAGAAPLLKKLEERGLIALEDAPPRASDQSLTEADPERPAALTAEQGPVVAALEAALGEGYSAHLIEGVTGSGKTEIYLRLIEAALARGEGALVLVPEIALTPQLVGRFQARFGQTVALLHSGLTDAERRENWWRLHRGEARIAVGVRSAIYAPVDRLGVVVVDEEHDGSFKQEEGLCYNARDLAAVRARQADVPLVLGSATPSLESLANVERGRYVLHTLEQRVADRPLPEVQVVDLRQQRPALLSGESETPPLLTDTLVQALEETLGAGQQAILFLNRRGQAPALLCTTCGETQKCPNCEVSLTLHRAPPLVLCHYCGYDAEIPRSCGPCGGELETAGAGTQALEREVVHRFPTARVLRLDRDATRQRGALAEILAGFATGSFDVMVGTQMVAKGHDFPGVTLVGVVLADQGLWIPDLRAGERAVQLLSQVSGRAGRGEDPGRVILQSWRPEHPAIQAALAGDYGGFARQELELREAGRWPPFCRLLLVRIDGGNARKVEHAALAVGRAAEVAALESPEADLEILGPAPAPLSRLRNKTRWQLLVKAGSPAAVRWLGGYLSSRPPPSGVRISLDVDPMSML